MEGVDAYTDDRRVVGNSLMAQSRIHIAAVDARLAALVGRLEADLTGRRNEALRTANDAVRNALILAVVAVLVGPVLTFMVMRSITVPLQRLVGAMSQSTQGNLAAVLPPPRHASSWAIPRRP